MSDLLVSPEERLRMIPLFAILGVALLAAPASAQYNENAANPCRRRRLSGTLQRP